MKAFLSSLLLLLTIQVHAQISFRTTDVKTFNKAHPKDEANRQPYAATFVLGATQVRVLDNTAWGNILYPVVHLEKAPDTYMHRWVCEDRVFTYDFPKSTLTVTYPTTNEVNVYYGALIEIK